MNSLLKTVGAITLFIGLIFFRLFVLTKIWALTVVPNFNVPQIGLWQTFALGWFIGAMTYDHKKTTAEDSDVKAVTKKVLTTIITLLASWGLAYLIF